MEDFLSVDLSASINKTCKFTCSRSTFKQNHTKRQPPSEKVDTLICTPYFFLGYLLVPTLLGVFRWGGIFLTPEIMNWCTLRCTRKNKLVSLPWPGYFCLPLPYFYEFLMIDKAVSTFSGWVRILTASFSSCALLGFSLPSCVITVHSAPQMFASDRLTLDALHPIRCLLTWQLWNSQHALHVKTNSTRDPCSAGRLYSLLYHTPENEPVDSRQFSMKSPQIIRSRPHRFGARKRRGMAIGLTAYLANIAGASWLYQYLSMSS